MDKKKRSGFAVMCGLIGMVKPLVSPSDAPTTNELIGPTLPTAAKASVETYLPTMMLSTSE